MIGHHYVCEWQLDHEILYSRDANLDHTDYSDADWAENADVKKSTSRGCFYFRYNFVA